MTTLVGRESHMNSLLKHLIEIDYDAIDAYDATLARLKSEPYRRQLSEFRADHLRHVEELSAVLRESGQKPPKGPDIKRVLTHGKVVLAGLMGDRALLFAMLSNEGDSHLAYQRATHNDAAPARVKELLRSNLADERRHREWLEEEVGGEEPPYPPPAGPAV